MASSVFPFDLLIIPYKLKHCEMPSLSFITVLILYDLSLNSTAFSYSR